MLLLLLFASLVVVEKETLDMVFVLNKRNIKILNFYFFCVNRKHLFFVEMKRDLFEFDKISKACSRFGFVFLKDIIIGEKFLLVENLKPCKQRGK